MGVARKENQREVSASLFFLIFAHSTKPHLICTMKVQNLKEDFLCRTKTLSVISMLVIISSRISYYRPKKQVSGLVNGECDIRTIFLITRKCNLQHCLLKENFINTVPRLKSRQMKCLSF